jgi:hypothetical protein
VGKTKDALGPKTGGLLLVVLLSFVFDCDANREIEQIERA